MIKKRFGISVLILLVLSLTVYAATRPIQGSNGNTWGDDLNAWLDVAHDSTGNIKDNYITSAMINDNTIKGTDVAQGTMLNVSAIAVGNSTNGGTNITGIIFGRTNVNVDTIAAGACVAVFVNVTGATPSSTCIINVDPTVIGTNSSLSNVTLFPMNATLNNCRLRMCNTGPTATVDPSPADYMAIAISTGSGTGNGGGT